METKEQPVILDKRLIRTFATESRTRLREHVEDRLRNYGIRKEGIATALPTSTKDTHFFDIGNTEAKAITGSELSRRLHLVEDIKRRMTELSLAEAVEEIIDETAYTWFNRLIAIRFMEVNEYLHNSEGKNHRLRILSSSEQDKSHMSTDSMDNPFGAGFSFTLEEEKKIRDYQSSHNLAALFRLLFLKQCSELSGTLGFLFSKADGPSSYLEMLFDIPYTTQGGIIRELVDTIPEAYFNVSRGGQIEILGWLYQYYNSDVKDEVFGRPASQKIQKQDIPAATQLFTPQWIVEYMVQNSLGKLWVNAHPDSTLQEEWAYYLAEAEQSEAALQKLEEIRSTYNNLDPRKITLIDPAMGSGHILVYAFELLMAMYKSAGYRERDAARHIINENLFGLEIDDRAHQLALFAVLMKAREYDRNALASGLSPQLYAIKESNYMGHDHLAIIKEKSPTYRSQIDYLVTLFDDAKEYGSILKVEEKLDYEELAQHLASLDFDNQISFGDTGIEETKNQLLELLKVAGVLHAKYHIVVTNPPYMGSRGMNPKLAKYLLENYPDSRSDLFAVFVEAGIEHTLAIGYSSMVTMQSWMFLKSYEKMRENIVNRNTIVQLMHMNNMVMEIAFGTAVTILSPEPMLRYTGKYHMVKYEDLIDGVPYEFPVPTSRYNETTIQNFTKIPGMPIAYWITDKVINAYNAGIPLGEISSPRKGNSTSNNKRFLRYWFEVSEEKMNIGSKDIVLRDTLIKRWIPYNKGGGYRKWYGLNWILTDWYDDAAEIRAIKTAVIANYQYFMKPGLTWSTVSSGNFSIRKFGHGFIFDNGGCSIFDLGEKERYLLSLLNSRVFSYIFEQINPIVIQHKKRKQ